MIVIGDKAAVFVDDDLILALMPYHHPRSGKYGGEGVPVLKTQDTQD